MMLYNILQRHFSKICKSNVQFLNVEPNSDSMGFTIKRISNFFVLLRKDNIEVRNTEFNKSLHAALTLTMHSLYSNEY